MILPDKIKISGRTYLVEYVDFDERLQQSPITGSVVHYKQKIQIDTAAHREWQEMSLLHEMIHAVDNNLSLDFNEDTIRRLGNGLYQVLNDNGFLKKDK